MLVVLKDAMSAVVMALRLSALNKFSCAEVNAAICAVVSALT